MHGGQSKNHELKHRIEHALRTDQRVSSQAISVDVSGDDIVLRGTVQSARRKLAADEIARRIVERAVDNRLVVETPTLCSDEELAGRIYRVLQDADNVPSGTVAVDVRAGFVELTGCVTDDLATTSTRNVVLAVPGVRSVESRLRIDGDAVRRDAALARKADTTLATHGLPARVVVADSSVRVLPLDSMIDFARATAVLDEMGLKSSPQPLIGPGGNESI